MVTPRSEQRSIRGNEQSSAKTLAFHSPTSSNVSWMHHRNEITDMTEEHSCDVSIFNALFIISLEKIRSGDEMQAGLVQVKGLCVLQRVLSLRNMGICHRDIDAWRQRKLQGPAFFISKVLLLMWYAGALHCNYRNHWFLLTGWIFWANHTLGGWLRLKRHILSRSTGSSWEKRHLQLLRSIWNWKVLVLDTQTGM